MVQLLGRNRQGWGLGDAGAAGIEPACGYEQVTYRYRKGGHGPDSLQPAGRSPEPDEG
ncbi:hypothetical protein D3C77_757870 [compost metagenome]